MVTGVGIEEGDMTAPHRVLETSSSRLRRVGASNVDCGRILMLDHVAIQVADVDAAADFYLRVFAPLGIREAMRYDREGFPVVGLSGPDGFPHFWLGPATAPLDWEVHIAFTAPDRAAVDQVHRAAISAGAEILHAPRLWPEYHPDYYGVFLRDLDGNNAEAVHHGFPAPAGT
jgi:catechol 2,3-dioxygenase-like lactoylglutathione lyase family enzyme